MYNRISRRRISTAGQLLGTVWMVLAIVGCSQDVNSISPKEAAAMVVEQKAVIIDVRENEEWSKQHISGAIHIPLGQVENRLSELAKYKDSLVITQCRSGRRSAQAAGTLRSAGFSKVYNLAGGILAWEQDGLQTLKSN